MKFFSGQPSEWNKLVSALPNSHILQSWEWAAIKAKYGWKQIPVTWEVSHSDNTDDKRIVAAAIILKRIIPLGGLSARLSILYIPKGPIMDWMDDDLRQRVLTDIQIYAKEQRAIFIKMDPDLVLGTGIPGTDEQQDNEMGLVITNELKSRKWIFSNEQVQFRNTAMIDLSPSENEIKANFKQKTRYNINLASRKGVIVRTGTLQDLHLLFNMYAETSIRDGFVIRDEGYYHTVWKTFMSSPNSNAMPFAIPLVAEFNGEQIAAVFVFCFASRAYYLYGMSRDIHREKMPNYLLQWEAIKIARAHGCLQYDLWGVPNEFNEKDPLWGVFRFKVSLGGSVIRTLGAWDYPVNSFFYQIYTQTLPKILNLMRLRGKSQTKRNFDQ